MKLSKFDLRNRISTTGNIREDDYGRLLHIINSMADSLQENINNISVGDIQSTNAPSFTINFQNNDIDTELRFGRTTGGTASFVWNGETVNCTQPLKPVNLGVNNISATEPTSPFAGQIWLQP